MVKVSRRNILKLLWLLPAYLFYRFINPKVEGSVADIKVPTRLIPNNSVYLIKDKQIAVVHKENKFDVISIACTHLGCTLNVSGDILICPCHGSEFTLEGNLLKGPAKRDLTKLSFSIQQEDICIKIV